MIDMLPIEDLVAEIIRRTPKNVSIVVAIRYDHGSHYTLRHTSNGDEDRLVRMLYHAVNSPEQAGGTTEQEEDN